MFRTIRTLSIFALLLAVSFPASSATTAAASAFGEQVNISLHPPVGPVIPVQDGPVPVASGAAPPPFNNSGSVHSRQVSGGGLGVLTTAAMSVIASSGVPQSDTASASATVHDLSNTLTGLLTLTALDVQSTSSIEGLCATSLHTAGNTTIHGGVFRDQVGQINPLLTNPPPNSVFHDANGVRIVLNEQIVAGNGTRTASIITNAIHILFTGAPMPGVGVLNGEIIIAQSHAQLTCDAAASQSADLSITNSDSPDPVGVGQTLTYLLTVTNRGPNTASDVTVTDSIPSEFNFLSASSSAGSCTGTAVVSCALGAISPGDQRTITIRVTSPIPGSFVNRAEVAGSTPDPDMTNNSATAATVVLVEAPPAFSDIAIAKDACPVAAVAGNPLTYTITVVNRGTEPATGVKVTDVLPPGVSLLSITPSQGSCTGNPEVRCDIGTMAQGARVDIVIVVVPTDASSVTNVASVESSMVEVDTANNQSSVRSDITRPLCPAATDLILPIAGQAPGANGSTWSTHLDIANAEEVAAEVKLEWYPLSPEGQTSPAASSTVELAPRSQLALQDLSHSLDLTGLGSLRLSSSKRFNASARIFNSRDESGTFGDQVAASRLVNVPSSSVLLQLSDGSGFRTNLGYFNPCAEAVELALSAYSQSGELLGATTITVPGLAGAMRPVFDLIDTVPMEDRQQSDFYVNVDVPGGRLFVYASVIDNATNDTNYVSPVPR